MHHVRVSVSVSVSVSKSKVLQIMCKYNTNIVIQQHFLRHV